jgi:hypothetical protein
VAAAHWCALRAVVQYNSLVCPFDYVLSQSGSCLRVFKTL